MTPHQPDDVDAPPGLRVGFLVLTLAAMLPLLFSGHAAGQATPPEPDANLELILIRDALTALNQANWTGNYTVMRDYASPNFARANDPVQLTAIFHPIRAQRLNLAPTLVLVPKITKSELTQTGKRLQLAGFFPSEPKQIHFNLIFEPIMTRWRLFGISVWATDASIEANTPQRVQAPAESPGN